MIARLLTQIENRFAELSRQMTDPEVINDRERYAEVGRAYRQLEPAHELVVEYRRAESDMEGAADLVDEDEEFAQLYETSKLRIEQLGDEIRLAMVDRDPNDDRDVIIELRPGTGGDEAGLFAGDLYRMLARYAERRGFKTETLAADEGGHYTLEVKGDGAYS
ncbi:MAG: PCRF domain-containing protein, partial [Thermoleophilia bacterium]|nr:PCRF domain-containing protein [Thermoleophilia bacterium]